MRTKKLISSCRLIKAKAKELMLAGENHLNIILALITVSSAAVAPVLICSMLYGQLGEVLYTLLLLSMELFLVSPMVFALLGMVRAMAKGERSPFSVVFSPYGSIKEYLKSLMMSLISAILLLMMIFGVAMLVGTAASLFNKEMAVVEAVLSAFVGLIITVLSVLLTFRLMVVPALVSDGVGLLRSVKRSFAATKRKGFRMLYLMLGLFPLTLISIIAVCVPLYVYTLPYLLCVYSVGVDALMKNNE